MNLPNSMPPFVPGKGAARGKTAAKKTDVLWGQGKGTPAKKSLRLVKESHEAILQTKSIDALKEQLELESFSRQQKKELKSKPVPKKIKPK
jgi:hypothetical protein